MFQNNSTSSLTEANTGSSMQNQGLHGLWRPLFVRWQKAKEGCEKNESMYRSGSQNHFSHIPTVAFFSVGHLTETHDPSYGKISQGILFSLPWSLANSEPCLRPHVKWFVLANNTFSVFLLHTSPSLQLYPRNLRLSFREEFLPAECQIFWASKNSYALQEYLMGKTVFTLDDAGFPQFFTCQWGPRALRGSSNVQALPSLVWPWENSGSTKKVMLGQHSTGMEECDIAPRKSIWVRSLWPSKIWLWRNKKKGTEAAAW